MSLPILPTRSGPSSDADLLRLFDKTDFRLAQQLGEEEQLECGAAFANAEFPAARAANHVREAALTPGMTAREAVDEVEGFFEMRGTRCLYWMMNRSAAEENARPLVEHLMGLGYTADSTEVMYLRHRPAEVVREVGGIKIIPARASYRHAQELAADAARERGVTDVSTSVGIHTLCIDDPQCDAMLALTDGRAIGRVYVVSVGDMGRVENLYVLKEHRGQGIGRTLMSRALESCARSLFKHVFLRADAANAVAMGMYRKLGFERIGETVQYRRPLGG